MAKFDQTFSRSLWGLFNLYGWLFFFFFKISVGFFFNGNWVCNSVIGLKKVYCC